MQRKRSILAIDNDVGHRFILQESLSELGDVVLASSGYEGIHTLASRPFDVVVTDYRMENGNGLDVARHISENQINVPVILVTSFGFYELVKRAFNTGVLGFVEKPYEKRDLQSVVQRAFEIRDGKRWKRIGELALKMEGEIEEGRKLLSRLVGLTRDIRERDLLNSSNVPVLILDEPKNIVLPFRRKKSKHGE